jgi:hypothetical protein
MTTRMTVLCRSYAAHVGLREPRNGFAAEAERRLSLWPAWARLAAGFKAAAMRWLAPFFLLARPRRFESLSPDDMEAVLARLQRARWPAFRGAFLMVKTIMLGTCYGLRPS